MHRCARQECFFQECAFLCAGVATHADLRENYTPGNKYTHWELRGVCVRLELGPKDMAAGKVMAVRRDNGKKELIAWPDLVARLPKVLEEMQADMLSRAEAKVNAALATVCTCWRVAWHNVSTALGLSEESSFHWHQYRGVYVTLRHVAWQRPSRPHKTPFWLRLGPRVCLQAWSFDEFKAELAERKRILAPWCEDTAIEKEVKKLTTVSAEESGAEGGDAGAKTLCIPFEQPAMPEGQICIFAKAILGEDRPAKNFALWGRSY